jgi:sugar phosphate isomerase/epimerase
MRFVYFTKTLRELHLDGLVTFCKDTGVEGFDLTVRPGYPVTPDNAAKELPAASKRFKEAGLVIGLVTAPTDLVDPASKQATAIFDACSKANVPAVKIGYFPYRAPFEDCLKAARQKLAGFAKLAAKTKVKACYHTHSGANLGNNAAGMRLLLQDIDPHHVGVFFDTGHTAVNGGPVRMELDMVRPWLSLVAIKDMAWSKERGGWSSRVVPVGDGMVRWADVAKGLKECKFNGTVSLHGEYHAKDLAERKKLAKAELAALKKAFGVEKRE